MIAVSLTGWKVAAFFTTTHADDKKARNPLSSEDFKPAASQRVQWRMIGSMMIYLSGIHGYKTL